MARGKAGLVTFHRIRSDRGIYTASVGKKKISIADGNVYSTDDAREIEFLSADLELEQYTSDDEGDE